MTWAETFQLFSTLDAGALAFVLVSWFAIGWRIEHPGAGAPSVTVLMSGYRRDWMREMLGREVRIFDAQTLASLRQGTAFFASTCLLATGAMLALIGNTAPLVGLAEDLTQADAPDLLLKLRLMLPVLFLATAFLKFVWANRIFGYCAVMMAAVPNDPADPKAPRMAAMAAELNIRAAMNFNRGLRAMYFALGGLAWVLGPWALGAAVAAVLWLLWSREFASLPRRIVMGDMPKEEEH